MNHTQVSVPSSDASLRSPLRYPGGKTRVAKRFAPYFPPHDDYREPLAGGAAVFFHKSKARTDWINDLQPGLYAFYKTVRDSFDIFAKACQIQTGDLHQLFDYWAGRRDLMDAQGDDSLSERAVQFYYLNRTVWGGRVVYDPARSSRLYFSNPQGWGNLDKKLAHLAKVSAKLQGVRITGLDFAQSLADATPGTFVYADPPYMRDSLCHATDKLFDKSFDLADHQRLADALKHTPAKVMISYDDCPEVRKLYAGWHFVELSWKYSGTYAVTGEAKVKGIREKKATGSELLILNYEPPVSHQEQHTCPE